MVNNVTILIKELSSDTALPDSWLYITKVVFLVAIGAMSVFFGLFPILFQACRNSTKLIGFANAFSGGVFLGIALFHLLPESCENFEAYFENSDSSLKDMPLPYIFAFGAYALILFIEKIAFDSHSLIEHDHEDEEEYHAREGGELKHDHPMSPKKHNQNHNDLNEPLINKRDKPGVKKSFFSEVEEKGDSHNHNHNHNYSNTEPNPKNNNIKKIEHTDEEEEALKTIVSSKGQFVSFLGVRNQMVSPRLVLDENQDRALMKANLILTKTIPKSFEHKEEIEYLQDRTAKNLQTENYKRKGSTNSLLEVQVNDEHHHHFLAKSNLTPYLLLIALSVHGFFEGIALGIQNTIKDGIILAIAILAHKWAESFTLGISFFKAKTPEPLLIKLILLFSAFTPVGIILGIFLTGSSKIIEAVALALSTGTFLYISASEVIVEEFANTKYKYQKFFLFLTGGVFIGALAVLE